MNFFLRVIRNGLILGGLYFLSLYTTQELCWEIVKPALLFLAGYILTELAVKYKLNTELPKKKKVLNGVTLIF